MVDTLIAFGLALFIIGACLYLLSSNHNDWPDDY